MFGFGTIGQLSFGDRMSRGEWEGAATWSGNANVEFVSTTAYVDMIESGQAILAYAAEIKLRSL